MRSSLLLLAALFLAGCAMHRAAPPETMLHSRLFGEDDSGVTTLFVVINGDGVPETRGDQYGFAERISDAVPDSAAVAILRPGYGDAEGNRSPGERGTDTGDNYSADRIADIAGTVSAYRGYFPQARTIVIGDNGGAAIAADLAGLRPALVDGMVLVSCPCTLPEWRRFMDKRAPEAAWDKPVKSLDPLQTAGGIQSGLRAAMLVGGDDKVTPKRFSRPYAEALALRGIATDYRIVPGKEQLRLDDPEVLAATEKLASALAGDAQ